MFYPLRITFFEIKVETSGHCNEEIHTPFRFLKLTTNLMLLGANVNLDVHTLRHV
jgi:hypothetical protein